MDFHLPKTNNYFINANGHRIHYQHFTANSTKFIFYIHGYNSHCNYKYLINLYNSLPDYNLCAIDLEGHGYSEGERGCIRYSMVKDICDWITLICSKYIVNEFTVLGSSFGGVLATLAQFLLHPILMDNWKKTVLIAPAFKVKECTPAKKYLVEKFLLPYIPDYCLPDFIPWRPKAEQSLVCPDFINFCREERLTRKKNITFRNLHNIITMGEMCLDNIEKIKNKCTIVHDPMDELTCYETAKQFCDLTGSEMIAADNCKHNVLANNVKLISSILEK